MEWDPAKHLYLPGDPAARAVATDLGAGVYVMWDDVKAQPFDPDQVPSMLSGLPLDQALSVLGAISIFLSTRAREDPVQRIINEGAMALSVCRDGDGQRVADLLKSRRRDVFVFSEQLLMAATIALLYAKGAPQAVWEKGLIGDLLLAASALISLEDDALSDGREFGVAVALRKVGAFSTEQARYLIPRYYELLVRRAPQATTPGGTPPWESMFAEAAGLRIREYLSFAILYYAPFSQPPKDDGFMPPGYPQRTADFERAFHDPDVLDNARAAFVTDSNTAAGELSAPEPGELTNYMPIRKRPLIRTANGQLLPLSMQFALDKMSTGVYWTLFDAYLAEGRLSDFTNQIGRAFEGYVLDLFDSAYSQFKTEGTKRYRETDIAPAPGSANPPAKRADCLILDGDSLIVMEISTVSLRVATINAADTKAFEGEIRDKFRHEFLQVFDTIEGLRSGTLQINGLDLGRVHHVFPVLVLLQPFPQLPMMWEKLRLLLSPDWPIWPRRPWETSWDAFGRPIAATQVHFPQIVSAEELEMLEPLIREGHTRLPAVLLSKLNHVTGACSDMKTFLLRFSDLPELVNERLASQFDSIVEEVRHYASYHAG